ncbi:hypothetical protein X975_20802, partial [Stegodyphus mimosarum]
MLSLLFLLLVTVHGSDVTRDFFGDIFRMRDCHNGSRCDNGGTRPALEVPGRPCYCQCAPTHLAYREDKQQCVKDIKECYMSVFYRPFTVEAIPLVYLPTSGQLVHPDAHLSLSGRRTANAGFPKCKAAVSQYLTQDGWRTLIRSDNGGGPVFGLFTDGNKTFLQFLGSTQDRRLLQQHMTMVRLFCKIPDYSPFETCVAFRVGWVPGIDSVEGTETPSHKANMMVVGLSLGVLGLVYVFAVLVYLKIRRQLITKQKTTNDQEAKLQSNEENPDEAATLHRIESSKRLEMYHTSSLGRQKSGTFASRLRHDPWAQMSPIVETYNRTWTDRMGQHGCEFRAQDFKLQPEFFDPEFMASPPQQVLDYLERLHNSVTFARHRLRSCYRYQPTLIDIPEDDYYYQEQESKKSQSKEVRTTPDGGSASSMGSLIEYEQKDNAEKVEAPKIPPRKPKRKAPKDHQIEPKQNSEQEQKDIQNAMNTLNDTLDALEFDIYNQDMLQPSSECEQVSVSAPNSNNLDTDDFDSSSCSSLSAVTVLGKPAKKQADLISNRSLSVENNLSEEFSTFSNSTFNMNEGMAGLFHDGNKVDSVEKSAESCDSPTVKNELVEQNDNEAQTEENCKEDKGTNTHSGKCHDNGCCPTSTEKHENGDGEEAIPNGHKLCKSSSNESMTTISTEMTTDSLDSRPSSPNHPSPTPSLVEMWINRLVQNSVPYSKTRRKCKKLALPENEIENWEHVCQKHKDSCPMHDLNDSEPNIIDKLAHYGSKTMAGCDVAGYFQSLKQDVLKEHLKSWLHSNNQSKRHKGFSINYNGNENSHKRPLVPNGHDPKLLNENGLNAAWSTFSALNGTETPLASYKDADYTHQNSVTSDISDSLEQNSSDAKVSNGTHE